MNWKSLLSLALLALQTPAWAQSEPVEVKRATVLRDAPTDNARGLVPLPEKSPLNRLPPRQGPWVQVRTALNQVGWVHMFDISTPTVGAASTSGGGGGSSFLRGVTGFFSKPTGTTTTATSTVGIRGLDAEDIAKAQPDLAALKAAEGLRASAGDARQFASAAGLGARSVDELTASEGRQP